MKPSGQLKCGSSNTKSKKSSKDRDKRKLPGNVSDLNNHTSSEKGSPTKESTKLYAGIDSDSLTIYAEQTGIEHLADEITNTLTEEINYRLRYIINDSLIKARLSGRNAISSQDVEHTFENLKIDKVYGAPSHPNWVSFGYQNLYYLDDKNVNLVEMAREDNVFHQYSEPAVTKKWIPEQKECSKALRNYFTTMCQLIVSNDVEMRRMALKNVSENPRIGTIIEWFYNFGYILLSKDITYDCLTLRALDLITVLENSQMCRMNVSEKLLKLLVRLILQRLLKSAMTQEILKPICNVLSVLCERVPLKDFVMLKVQQKMGEVFHSYDLAVIMIINSLGIEAVKNVLLPNLDLFLYRAGEKRESSYAYSMLESYYILFKEDMVDSHIYDAFFDCFGETLIVSSPCRNLQKLDKGKGVNFARVKSELMKTWKRVVWVQKISCVSVEQVFEMPPANSKLRKKLDEVRWERSAKQESVVVGRTTLLLPVFQHKKRNGLGKCCNHMLWYQL